MNCVLLLPIKALSASGQKKKRSDDHAESKDFKSAAWKKVANKVARLEAAELAERELANQLSEPANDGMLLGRILNQQALVDDSLEVFTHEALLEDTVLVRISLRQLGICLMRFKSKAATCLVEALVAQAKVYKDAAAKKKALEWKTWATNAVLNGGKLAHSFINACNEPVHDPVDADSRPLAGQEAVNWLLGEWLPRWQDESRVVDLSSWDVSNDHLSPFTMTMLDEASAKHLIITGIGANSLNPRSIPLLREGTQQKLIDLMHCFEYDPCAEKLSQSPSWISSASQGAVCVPSGSLQLCFESGVAS